MRALGVKFALMLCLVFALPFCTSVSADPPDGLRGEAFTDPSKIQEMPEGWEERPIEHYTQVEKADLVVTLDQHLYPAILPLIQDYASQKGLKIVVTKGTCGISAGRLVGKSVDIGGFCCPPGKEDRLPGLRFHTLGIEPILLIVHPDNPVDDITMDEARRIFRGEIYHWSELGGRNLPIKTVGRLHCKLRPGHWKLLLDNEDLFSPRLTEVGTIPDMITLVSSNRGAIGYEAFQMVRRYQDRWKVKVLKIDGLDPNDSGNLSSGEYPLYRILNITTWEGAHVENPDAQRLVNYLLEKVETLHDTFGIIPASALRKAGWKFEGDELVGEPR
jgi:phosphate transport system substrate-binding protein